jgi:hypothetical protein
VDFPIKNGGSFHSYVKLPEGNKQPEKKRWEHVAEIVSASFCGSFQKYIEAPHARLKTRFSQFLSFVH